MQSAGGERRSVPEKTIGSAAGLLVAGTIVDSWVESARSAGAVALLLLQVAPRAQPDELVIVEAEVSLVADGIWLEDLSENLCHGCSVVVFGSPSPNGFFAAADLQLMR